MRNVRRKISPRKPRINERAGGAGHQRMFSSTVFRQLLMLLAYGRLRLIFMALGKYFYALDFQHDWDDHRTAACLSLNIAFEIEPDFFLDDGPIHAFLMAGVGDGFSDDDSGLS